MRAVNELADFLDEELAWRKRELTAVHFLIQGSRQHERPVMLRAGICLVYAHWEGFVKNASTAYLNYIDQMGLQYRELAPCLVALCLRGQFRELGASQRVSIHTQLTSFLLSELREKAELPWEYAIETRSNLNFDTLQEILCVLGLDYTPYSTREQLIDERLVGQRNRIAHGEFGEIDLVDYDQIYHAVLDLIDRFRTDVMNAVVTHRFRRAPQPQSP
jgi:hypothetical protein